jgi:hypothetical protein
MGTTLLILIGMVVDIGIGAAAHKAVHKLDTRVAGIEKKLDRKE